MAGNLVKWWKHKILGGYKQFSVQECTTDSEELVQHQVRASSSCSAPPDLLLVSDRENSISYRSPNSLLLTNDKNPGGGGGGGMKPNSNPTANDYIEILQKLNSTKIKETLNMAGNSSHPTTNYNKQSKNKNKNLVNKTNELLLDLEGIVGTETSKDLPKNRSSTPILDKQQVGIYGKDVSKDEKMHFEEFTCDVSVEGGKSSKPLQFSFTFYDLDGHHGKITKDDIVGIVYTIYESIGKSVVVPHHGSKTINVRLTFSPESKSKSNEKNNQGNKNHSHGNGHGHGRRQHRYKPRKLLDSDEEEEEENNEDHDADADDTNSEKEKENQDLTYNSRKTKSSNSKNKSSKVSSMGKKSFEDYTEIPSISITNPQQSQSITETYYDSLPLENLKCCTKDPIHQHHHQDCSKCSSSLKVPEMEKPSAKVKVLRKTRRTAKHHHLENLPELRQRSLSVGNEVTWKNRHLLHPQVPTTNPMNLQANQENAYHHLNKTEEITTLDGVQLRNPLRRDQQQFFRSHHLKRNSAECWKTAFNRNDLISIIRESMEKNRLCFQLNEKPQANVTPIRQPQQKRASLPLQQSSSRLKSTNVSKIPTLIANHNLSFINKNNLENHNPHHQHHHHQNQANHHDNQSSNGSLYHNLQPHIPIYHQQMAINPAVVAAQNNMIGHSKINPCGYDSFLHATICGGNNNHNHNLLQSTNNNNNNHQPHYSTTTPPPPPPPTLLPKSLNPAAAALSLNLKQFPSSTKLKNQNQQQPIATVQPIISVPNTTTKTITNTTIKANNCSSLNANTNGAAAAGENAKILNPTSHQIKLSKILRSGSYTQNYQHHQQKQHHSSSKQNSPQYRGYQRLQSSSSSNNPLSLQASSNKQHNLSSLSQMKTSQNFSPKEKSENLSHHLEEKEKSLNSSLSTKAKHLKTYENLLYAKLREDLHESGLNNSPVVGAAAPLPLGQLKEKEKYRKNRNEGRKSYRHHLSLKTPNNSPQILSKSEKTSDYLTMLNMNYNDALECENLLGQTTDEETISDLNTPQEENGKLSILESEETLPTPTTATTSTTLTLNTSEALIDLNDDPENDDIEELETPSDLVLDTNKTLHQKPNGDLEDLEDDEEDLDQDLEEEEDLDLELDEEEDHEVNVEVDLVDVDELCVDIDDEDEDDDEDDHTQVAAIKSSHMSPSSSKAALITTTNINNNNNNTINNSNNLNNTSNTSTSSLIHRCVHEHIHHHYHHFEKKDE